MKRISKCPDTGILALYEMGLTAMEALFDLNRIWPFDTTIFTIARNYSFPFNFVAFQRYLAQCHSILNFATQELNCCFFVNASLTSLSSLPDPTPPRRVESSPVS